MTCSALARPLRSISPSMWITAVHWSRQTFWPRPTNAITVSTASVASASPNKRKKMLQRRARRRSTMMSAARRSSVFRSQFSSAMAIPSVDDGSLLDQQNAAVALHDAQSLEPLVSTRPAGAATVGGIVKRAMRRAGQMTTLVVEKLERCPVERKALVCTDVHIAAHHALGADREGGYAPAIPLDLESHARPSLDEAGRFGDHPLRSSHARSSSIECTVASGAAAASPAGSCAP